VTGRAEIEARLDLVALCEGDPTLRHWLRTALKALPDIGRAIGRLVAGRGTPRDLGLLRDGLAEARRLHDKLACGRSRRRCWSSCFRR
jgi:DNA mismatch repair protein MutS